MKKIIRYSYVDRLEKKKTTATTPAEKGPKIALWICLRNKLFSTPRHLFKNHNSLPKRTCVILSLSITLERAIVNQREMRWKHLKYCLNTYIFYLRVLDALGLTGQIFRWRKIWGEKVISSESICRNFVRRIFQGTRLPKMSFCNVSQQIS